MGESTAKAEVEGEALSKVIEEVAAAVKNLTAKAREEKVILDTIRELEKHGTLNGTAEDNATIEGNETTEDKTSEGKASDVKHVEVVSHGEAEEDDSITLTVNSTDVNDDEEATPETKDSGKEDGEDTSEAKDSGMEDEESTAEAKGSETEYEKKQ